MQKEKSLYPLSLLTAFAASSPKGTPYGNAGNFIAAAKSRPLGEGGIAVGDDGRGALFQKATNQPKLTAICFNV